MRKVASGYQWERKQRMTKFRLYDLDKWAAQNNAECIDFVEGCLLDNMVYSCKRGTAFIFEEAANEWTSMYMVYFFPYKEQENNKEYDQAWERWNSLVNEIEMEG